MADEGYKMVFTREARARLEHLSKKTAASLVEKLRQLTRTVRVYPHHVMKGKWKGYYRLRYGAYCVIYSLNHPESVLLVERIGHRSDVYNE